MKRALLRKAENVANKVVTVVVVVFDTLFFTSEYRQTLGNGSRFFASFGNRYFTQLRLKEFQGPRERRFVNKMLAKQKKTKNKNLLFH